MSLFRPEIDRIAGYTPGEQPQEGSWVKLNTNENPYPPSPRVREAVQKAIEGRLNVYPDPLATRFRKAAAQLYDVDPESVLPANGSDENLTILLRSFVSPGELVAFPYPSYVLYETLAEIQGARHQRLILNRDWSWPTGLQAALSSVKLMLVPNPNSPSGNQWNESTLHRLLPPQGLLVVDQAYADFCDTPVGGQLLRGPAGDRIVLTRTLSKSYSLAGIRFGFAIARPKLVQGMRKVKDSYNCNTLSLAAAVAAIEDQDWMRQNVERIHQTRASLNRELEAMGFDVVPSQANFVWATHPDQSHQYIYSALKERHVLVRYMSFPDSAEGQTLDGLRITVGTDAEIDAFLTALREVLRRES